jgi:CBS domain-containing protein
MRCSEIMKTDIVRVDAAETIQLAARRMRDANVGFLPVCDSTGRVLGTLTDRDIAIRVAAEDRIASSAAVSEVMTNEVVCCRVTDDLGRAEDLMALHKKSRILVTNEEGFLEGVLSLSDIAQVEDARRTAKTIREVTSREARL